MGSCTAGGAYVPAMSDEIDHRARNQGTIFLGGPPLVKAATGEVVDAEELGGGDVHTQRLGRGRPPGARTTRTRCRSRATSSPRLNRRKTLPVAAQRVARAASTRASELYGDRARTTRASPSTCARSSRASSTAASSTSSRRATARRWSPASRHLHGYPVGIVANNGILFAESALKGAHFIELCNQRGIPLVFLQNITGFMVGRKYENAGIAKRRREDGDRGRHRSHVPKFTVVIGGSFGAGNYAHVRSRLRRRASCGCGPTRASRVMGGEQAASVLATVKRDGIEAARQDWSADEEDAFKAPIREQYESQGNPYYATARLWDDGIIDPADTRRVLGLALSASFNAPIQDRTRFGVFRM